MIRTHKNGLYVLILQKRLLYELSGSDGYDAVFLTGSKLLYKI